MLLPSRLNAHFSARRGTIRTVSRSVSNQSLVDGVDEHAHVLGAHERRIEVRHLLDLRDPQNVVSDDRTRLHAKRRTTRRQGLRVISCLLHP
jgi:hypothetical protein